MYKTDTAKRLNITIAPATWERLKTAVPRMERSRFIDNALKVYLTNLKRKSLKQRLKKEALANADKDLKIANEWFALENEVWDNVD
jgi:CopG family transcriptional regulator/antitoxin EndoAI